jgi:autotransporter strand-loop-strand O-heptosyltransferase
MNITDEFKLSFFQGPRVDIKGESKKMYTVKFINPINETVVFQQKIEINQYARAYQEYFIPWIIKIDDQEGNNQLTYQFTTEGKRIFITFESGALGDTICWLPYVEEFRKKHNCTVIVSTFFNFLFEKEYPELEFHDRTKPITNIQAVYKIGWFGSGEATFRNPIDVREQPLQKLAADILGMDYTPVKTKISRDTRPSLFNQGKYVVITTCSTAQFKYWNNPIGWQTVVMYLKSIGYTVINIGKHENNLSGVINMTGTKPMEDIINLIQNADFMIGLSSGLNWLAWGLDVPNIMISGMTMDWNEYENPYRIINKSVCHGCFNKKEVTFNKGKWDFCFFEQGKPDQFICTKTITPETVIEVIDKLRKDKNII